MAMRGTSMSKNQFLQYKEHVIKVLGEYCALREQHNIKDLGFSATIEREAIPFVKGYFTLAIIGEMSSGKSTFINTLIGANILPTGHTQTTSSITYIEHGAKASMKVKFADDHEQTFNGKDIKQILKKLVAVPEEYNALPINDINHLISSGDTLDDILAKKDGIEEATHRKSDTALWKKYIETHPKSSIAIEVHIYYPLSEDLHGWKIVDTPGVGAIGGIQEATKRMFTSRDKDGNKLIDAIIFLKRSDSNIESESDVVFFENVFNQLTNEAKARLFFIMTHATAQKFRLHRDEIIKMAQELYGQKYNIPQSRFTCVDSLMARFHDDIIAQGLSAKDIDPDFADPLEGWVKKECEAMYDLFSPLKRELKDRKFAINNENLLSLMEEWGNFSTLKKNINNFVREVKETSFQKIINLIREDYKLMIKKYEKEIEILNGGQGRLEEERQKLLEKRVEYNNVLNKLRQLAAITPILDEFKYVDDELSALSQKKSIDEVRVTYQNLIEEALSKEREIFNQLGKEFNEFCNKFDSDDIILKQVDFEALEKKAKDEATKEVPVFKPKAEKEGFFSPKEKTKNTLIRTDKVVDQVEKLRQFIAYVLKEARSIVKSFKEQMQTKVELLCEFVNDDIKEKYEAQEHRLEELKDMKGEKEQEMEKINNYISSITKNLETLNYKKDENRDE